MTLHQEVETFRKQHNLQEFQIINCFCMTEEQYHKFNRGAYSPTIFQRIMFITNTHYVPNYI